LLDVPLFAQTNRFDELITLGSKQKKTDRSRIDFWEQLATGFVLPAALDVTFNFVQVDKRAQQDGDEKHDDGGSGLHRASSSVAYGASTKRTPR
jgi:hypothetical protein